MIPLTPKQESAMPRALAVAFEHAVAAADDLQATIERLYPEGARICWRMARRIYHGHVVFVGRGQRIKVLNRETKKARFIDAAWVVE